MEPYATDTLRTLSDPRKTLISTSEYLVIDCRADIELSGFLAQDLRRKEGLIMGTHGAARTTTIADLSARRPFRRSGFALSAVQGSVQDTGQLPDELAAQYRLLADAGLVTYTVLSYRTPIGWVTTAGVKVVPDVRYSPTTSQHQTLVRVHV